MSTTTDAIDGDVSSRAALVDNPGADDKISLREAILAANVDDSVELILLPAGNHILTISGGGSQAAAWGDLDLTGDYEIRGAGEENTSVIQSADNNRIFEIDSGDIKISRLSIMGGDNPGRLIPDDSNGAGIWINNGATSVFENVTFSENISGNKGGAIYAEGSVTLINVTMTDNDAFQGGALYTEETAVVNIYDSDISGNSSEDDGGGIFNLGTVNIYNSNIDQNTAGDDGGGIFNSGTVDILDSNITANTADENGGGLSNEGNATLEASHSMGQSR